MPARSRSVKYANGNVTPDHEREYTLQPVGLYGWRKKMSLPLDPTYCCHCHDQPHNDCLDNTCAEFQFCK